MFIAIIIMITKEHCTFFLKNFKNVSCLSEYSQGESLKHDSLYSHIESFGESD